MHAMATSARQYNACSILPGGCGSAPLIRSDSNAVEKQPWPPKQGDFLKQFQQKFEIYLQIL